VYQIRKKTIVLHKVVTSIADGIIKKNLTREEAEAFICRLQEYHGAERAYLLKHPCMPAMTMNWELHAITAGEPYGQDTQIGVTYSIEEMEN
jgi:hypothetical protein